jgi:excisionase family DNA binding protein
VTHQPPQLIVLSVDTPARVLIAAALALGRRQLRANGTPVPDAFDELLGLLAARPDTAPSGQQRPALDHVAPLPEPAFVDYEGAARLMGVSARTIRRRAASGNLHAIRIGRRVLLRVADLEQYGGTQRAG